MAQITRPYKGVSAEQRLSLRRERLIDAALDVIGSDGTAALTMTAVCSRAGLTERYFYESFGDRDQLLCAVFDACLREVDEAMFAALDAAPADLLERCRAAAGAMVSVLISDPRKARLYSEAIGSEALRDRRAQAIEVHAEVLAAQIRELRGLDRSEDQAPLKLATLMLIGGLGDAIIGWLAGTLDLSQEMLIEECAQLAVAAAMTVQAMSRAGDRG